MHWHCRPAYRNRPESMSSGLEKTPNVFDRPVWRDPFFWVMLAMAVVWAAVIWYFFFS